MKDAGIFVAALPEHTSSALQSLDLKVLVEKREIFKQLLFKGMISTHRDLKNDAFFISEIITSAFHHSITICNIKLGFRAAGIWPLNE